MRQEFRDTVCIDIALSLKCLKLMRLFRLINRNWIHSLSTKQVFFPPWLTAFTYTWPKPMSLTSSGRQDRGGLNRRERNIICNKSQISHLLSNSFTIIPVQDLMFYFVLPNNDNKLNNTGFHFQVLSTYHILSAFYILTNLALTTNLCSR